MSIFKISFYLDLIFPIYCLACGTSSIRYLCPQCFKKLSFKGELKEGSYPNINQVFAVSSYSDKLAPLLIHAYKFKSAREISVILADYLRIFWQSRTLFLKSKYIVIPLPLSKRRLRRRGFNQTELIGKIFAQEFGYSLNLDLKRRHRRPQSKLKRRDRQLNIANSFYYKGKNLDGASVIILDDVLTSGATMTEAARVIKAAGAREIVAIAIFKG